MYGQTGALTVRLYECAGTGSHAQIDFHHPVKSAQETDFNGRPLTRTMSLSRDTLLLDLKPWEIVTLRLS